MKKPELSKRDLEVINELAGRLEMSLEIEPENVNSVRKDLKNLASRLESWSKADFHQIGIPVLNVIRIFRHYSLDAFIPINMREAVGHLHISYQT